MSDADTPSIVLNYKTRKEAEMALLKGKNFQVSQVLVFLLEDFTTIRPKNVQWLTKFVLYSHFSGTTTQFLPLHLVLVLNYCIADFF